MQSTATNKFVIRDRFSNTSCLQNGLIQNRYMYILNSFVFAVELILNSNKNNDF